MFLLYKKTKLKKEKEKYLDKQKPNLISLHGITIILCTKVPENFH